MGLEPLFLFGEPPPEIGGTPRGGQIVTGMADIDEKLTLLHETRLDLIGDPRGAGAHSMHVRLRAHTVIG